MSLPIHLPAAPPDTKIAAMASRYCLALRIMTRLVGLNIVFKSQGTTKVPLEETVGWPTTAIACCRITSC